MIARWLAPARSGGGERAGREAFYECTRCRSVVAEWTEDCPLCGELVVRVVDLPASALDLKP